MLINNFRGGFPAVGGETCSRLFTRRGGLAAHFAGTIGHRDDRLLRMPAEERTGVVWVNWPGPDDIGECGRDDDAMWWQYQHTHAEVTRAVEAELLAFHQLSLASFEVLTLLARAPDRRMRMTELAHATGLSTSGMTRVTDRLRGSGLLTKDRVPEDRRGFAATLTECGRQRLEKASVTHRTATERHFLSRLDDTDLRKLWRISQQLRGGILQHSLGA
jgi:DNA-binding MarR family transcriptional regulator